MFTQAFLPGRPKVTIGAPMTGPQMFTLYVFNNIMLPIGGGSTQRTAKSALPFNQEICYIGLSILQ